ncbi:MAG: hypothetical protein K6G53_02435 [Bacteroidales bacterium]|nr:hypothetical protein [Bacteroidales bacterium]
MDLTSMEMPNSLSIFSQAAMIFRVRSSRGSSLLTFWYGTVPHGSIR